MLWNDQCFVDLDEMSTPIWRYMDFPKFANMLRIGGLVFCRLDKLDDTFEGSFTKPMVALYGDDMMQSESGLPGSHATTLRAGFDEFSEIRQGARELRRRTYINCWHAALHESDAMWRIYSKEKNSICIKSRYSHLRGYLLNIARVGQVYYIDYEQNTFPIRDPMWPTMHKRKAYEYEKEVRAVYVADELDGVSSNTVTIAVGLPGLIEAVIVSPQSDEWFKDTVAHLCEPHGLKDKVRRSDLRVQTRSTY